MKFPKISQHELNTILALSVGVTLLLAAFAYFYKIKQTEGLKSSNYWRPIGYKDRIEKEDRREDWEVGDDNGDIVFQYKRKNLLKVAQDGSIQNVTVDKLKHRLNALEQKIKAKPSAGIPGKPGPQGIKGPVGPQGIMGDEGIQGSPGTNGLIGPRGIIGPRGLTNPSVGPRGSRGRAGTRGSTGSRGSAATLNKSTCLGAAKYQYGSRVVHNRGGLVSGSWGHVPKGCTIQAGGDWAAHWNTYSGYNGAPGYARVG
jgi:hypothetical protein